MKCLYFWSENDFSLAVDGCADSKCLSFFVLSMWKGAMWVSSKLISFIDRHSTFTVVHFGKIFLELSLSTSIFGLSDILTYLLAFYEYFLLIIYSCLIFLAPCFDALLWKCFHFHLAQKFYDFLIYDQCQNAEDLARRSYKKEAKPQLEDYIYFIICSFMELDVLNWLFIQFWWILLIICLWVHFKEHLEIQLKLWL